jgi:hypothetical protein
MENKELIYQLAQKLNLIIEVTKNGVINTYKFIDGKLYKLK